MNAHDALLVVVFEVAALTRIDADWSVERIIQPAPGILRAGASVSLGTQEIQNQAVRRVQRDESQQTCLFSKFAVARQHVAFYEAGNTSQEAVLIGTDAGIKCWL